MMSTETLTQTVLSSPNGRRPITATQLQEKVVIFILTIRKPGTERRVGDKSILATEADKNRFRVTKQIFDAKEVKDIQKIDTSIRNYIGRTALPSPFKEGVYALPIGLLEKVDDKMEEFAKERREAVEALKLVFAEIKDEARTKLGSHFNERDYAIDFDSAYRLEWQYVSLAAPEVVKGIDGRLYTREQERLQRQWNEAITEMRDALRLGLSELVNDLVTRLTASADGDKKVKPSHLLQRFEEFLSTFQARNVTGDEELADLAQQARNLLNGVDTKRLVESKNLQQQIAQDFKKVQVTLNKLELESKNRRRIRFDEE